MTVEEFLETEAEKFDGALLALWWDGKGDWEKAHEIAQDVAGVDGAWVHAYLHRKEGDVGECWVLVSAGGPGCGARRFEGGVGGDGDGDAWALSDA